MEVFADDRPVEREPVNIHDVLDHVKRLAQIGLRPATSASSRTTIRRCRRCSANRDQLIQVFLNLVKNAAEAIGDDGRDGEIELTTAFRPGRALCGAGQRSARVSLPLEFCVRDNGAGRARRPAAASVRSLRDHQAAGSGLGLALVAKIVGDHGGVIECESQPRRTIFRVLMPMYSASDRTTRTAHDRADEDDNAAGTILVADDDAAIRTV